MSKVTVVCLGKKAYNNVKIEQQSTIRKHMVKYIQDLASLGCSFEYVAHDHVAHDLLDEINISNKSCVDVIPTVEFDCWKKYFSDELDFITRDIPMRADRRVDYNKDLYKYPNVMQFKDKDEYLKKRREALHKNVRTAMVKFMTEQQIILFFTGTNDLCPKPSNYIYEGDGRIIIEVDCMTGIVNSYYGGMWMDYKTIRNVIEMEA